MSRSKVYKFHFWPTYKHAAHYSGKSESSRFLKAAGLLHGSEFGELAAWVRPSGGSAGREDPEGLPGPGQHVPGPQVLLAGHGLARLVQGPRGPQVTDHSQRHTAPRLQQSRIWLAIPEDCTGMPMRIQGSASGASALLSCHLTCDKRGPYSARARTNCRQVQHRSDRLPQRLADHALGRGARLTQVQLQAGGSWVIGLIEDGGADRERQIKGHDAGRYCNVCKALKGYQAGELTAEQALGRAGWGRATQHERSLLLEIFGIDRAEVDAEKVPDVPLKPIVVRPEPEPAEVTPEIEALVDALEASWSPKPRNRKLRPAWSLNLRLACDFRSIISSFQHPARSRALESLLRAGPVSLMPRRHR